MYVSLFEDTGNHSLDAMAVMALKHLSAQLLILLERQTKSQLPDWEYWKPSAETKQMAAKVPTTMAISDRDMEVIDNHLTN